ncbi:MAG: glycine cleavage system aminomethyltransferase GcvT [Proteobacteria bacterium]|nr:glycine cleavage system aminomethyltransferase GcvT [Pseudomonadota bacterium]
MSKQTALYSEHLHAGARMVDFAGWLMPLHYGSQLNEHLQVRKSSGMFDVSHMTVIDVQGDGATDYLRRLIANDVARLKSPGMAQYGALLNTSGGIIDDLIVYRRPQDYRLVVNAGTRNKVLDWINLELNEFALISPGAVQVTEEPLSMIAVQGPRAIDHFASVTGVQGLAEMPPFTMLERDDWLIARTGYTGEQGVEVILPDTDAVALWRDLAEVGVAPIGLGARDTLRLEAGLNLYGQDMDESTSPFISNIGWTVAWKPEDRMFIGREALEAQRKAGVQQKLTGLVLLEKGVVRHDCEVHTDAGIGVVTSGIFSPTLGYSIALARVPVAAQGDCEVVIRNRRLSARLVKPPFVRNGEKVFT